MAEVPPKQPLDDLPVSSVDNDNADNIMNGENDNRNSMELNESMSVDDWLDEAVLTVTKTKSIDVDIDTDINVDDNQQLVQVPDLLQEVEDNGGDNDVPNDDDEHDNDGDDNGNDALNVSALEMMMQNSVSSTEENNDNDMMTMASELQGKGVENENEEESSPTSIENDKNESQSNAVLSPQAQVHVAISVENDDEDKNVDQDEGEGETSTHVESSEVKIVSSDVQPEMNVAPDAIVAVSVAVVDESKAEIIDSSDNNQLQSQTKSQPQSPDNEVTDNRDHVSEDEPQSSEPATEDETSQPITPVNTNTCTSTSPEAMIDEEVAKKIDPTCDEKSSEKESEVAVKVDSDADADPDPDPGKKELMDTNNDEKLINHQEQQEKEDRSSSLVEGKDSSETKQAAKDCNENDEAVEETSTSAIINSNDNDNTSPKKEVVASDAELEELSGEKQQQSQQQNSPQTQTQTREPPQDRGTMLMNRFSNWKSKADAAIQNNQVLKMAHKNIEEKRKEVQKVVEDKIPILKNNIISTSTSTTPKRETASAAVETDANGVEEDDISYESNGRSIASRGSQGSSIYVDSDDDASSFDTYSDTSSIHLSPSKQKEERDENRKRTGSIGSAASSTRSSNSKSSWAPKPQTLFHGDLNIDAGAGAGTGTGATIADLTPLKRNITKNTANSDVASGYKGRYEQPTRRNNKSNRNRENVLKQLQRRIRAPSPPPLATRARKPVERKVEKHESQTALLQKMIPGTKIKELFGSLPEGHYVMVLKPGMLGVNLKQTFLSGNGVYVDFIIPGGNASKSGIVCVGDGLVKVSETNVSKGQIHDVPGIIAQSRRPAVLIFNGEHAVKMEQMDYLAVAIGVVNRILEESRSGKARTPLEDIQGTAHDLIVPQAPSKALRQEVESYAKQRNNQTASFSLITAACQQDQNFQKILRHAFRICTVDNRRLPFFASFLSTEDAFNSKNDEFGDISVAISASTRLMLYLELVSYKDLFSEASLRRRLDHAQLISSKFLLPRGTSNPLFDLRPMFPDHVLSSLQQSDNAVSMATISADHFKEIEACVEDSLAGSKFASFLLSDECARMRAYMRGTASYIDPQLASIVHDSSKLSSKEFYTARNHLKFMLIYLLCQKENDTLDKNFEKKVGTTKKESKRLKGSAAGLSCAVFISRVLSPAIDAAKQLVTEDGASEESSKKFQTLISATETFWETFIAPHGGLLEDSSYSNETNDLIGNMRQSLLNSVNQVEENEDGERLLQLTKAVVQNDGFIKSLPKLRNELVYDYYINHHPKYRAHMIHEFMCSEANTSLEKEVAEEKKGHVDILDTTPRLEEGVIPRLIRKLEIPEGVSRHCPMHKLQNPEIEKVKETTSDSNADFSLLFTKSQNDVESGGEASIQQMASLDQSILKDAVCVPHSDYAKERLQKKSIEEILPATVVSYTMVPPLKNRPFGEPIYFGRQSQSGWEVSLLNFMAPKGSNESDDFWYGVALVMNHVSDNNGSKEIKDTITLVLISRRNVIPAMRTSLSKLYEEKIMSTPRNRDCSALVNELETLKSKKDNSQILFTMLEPCMKFGVSGWLEQPVINQEKAFERSSVEFIVETLPPIPLSLLLVTTLLEQKIVFTSSRRSALVSMITGLRSLIQPLKWDHLIVPTAPSSLAGDLVQYPAPFILGIALDHKENIELLKRLPSDITLVDVDVGRVILTQKFSHHFESSTLKDDETATSSLLRSQVLNLAENLGNVLGVYQSETVWRADSPLQDSFINIDPAKKVEAVRKIAFSFVSELISGVNSCCYWIEEEMHESGNQNEQNIMFDEDRFFHLKKMRSEGLYFSLFKGEDLAISNHCSQIEPRPILALDMNAFSLVMETFIRGQAMSSFISSQSKDSMPFW